MTKYPEIFAGLAAEFHATEVKTLEKKDKHGRIHRFPYLTARSVMNRLDFTLGPENWCDRYVVTSDTSILCRLTIILPDGRRISKCDAGGAAGMSDPGDDDKSAFSDAFKRAAVKFGVGRYLYRDGVPDFTEGAGSGSGSTPASLPPVAEVQSAESAQREHANRNRGNWPPTGGRQLYTWLKKRDEEYPGLYRRVLDYAATKKLPVKMIEWGSEITTQVYTRTLAAIEEMDREREAARKNPVNGKAAVSRN